MSNLKQFKPGTYLLPKEGQMRVPGLIVATEKLLHEIEIERPLEQVRNVAHLPGIVGYSIAMPDIHWGYGFPIGGVAAMDPDEGVISPGGVGYDINCGVRIATAPIAFSDLDDKKKRDLIHHLFSLVPSGVGRGHKHQRGLSDNDYNKLLTQGARWCIEKGWGCPKDLEHIESYGVIEGADPSAVSAVAKARGKNQLGTIGSGNHFIEIGEVETITLPDIASAWGLEKGQLYIMIHSGSRGLGHQVCQDTLNQFLQGGFAEGLPDRQLVCAPIMSPDGDKYFRAMAAAANFAFANRQQILSEIRNGIQDTLAIPPDDIRLIYDVCHNIAKFEMHEFEGKKRRLCVHRKGATRALGKGHPELSPLFQQTGQPVLVPGDMGRASHLLVGLGNPLTWSSSCHGAGRARSRIQSKKAWAGRDLENAMKKQGVTVLASSYRTIAEEMPDAYKNVDDVVLAVEEAGLARRAVRLKPHLVIKG